MHKMLFQGLNFMEGSVFGITLQKKFRTIVMKRHCHNVRDKFSRHYESKTGFLYGQIVSEMAQNRGISAAHTCTTYYRQCLPRDARIHTVMFIAQCNLLALTIVAGHELLRSINNYT